MGYLNYKRKMRIAVEHAGRLIDSCDYSRITTDIITWKRIHDHYALVISRYFELLSRFRQKISRRTNIAVYSHEDCISEIDELGTFLKHMDDPQPEATIVHDECITGSKQAAEDSLAINALLFKLTSLCLGARIDLSDKLCADASPLSACTIMADCLLRETRFESIVSIDEILRRGLELLDVPDYTNPWPIRD